MARSTMKKFLSYVGTILVLLIMVPMIGIGLKLGYEQLVYEKIDGRVTELQAHSVSRHLVVAEFIHEGVTRAVMQKQRNEKREKGEGYDVGDSVQVLILPDGTYRITSWAQYYMPILMAYCMLNFVLYGVAAGFGNMFGRQVYLAPEFQRRFNTIVRPIAIFLLILTVGLLLLPHFA